MREGVRKSWKRERCGDCQPVETQKWSVPRERRKGADARRASAVRAIRCRESTWPTRKKVGEGHGRVELWRDCAPACACYRCTCRLHSPRS